MFEQDYIMRLIREMIRTLLKLLFHMDIGTETPTPDLLRDEESEQRLNRLLAMIDNGRINEAENQLSDLTADISNMHHLELALLFYSYLYEKDDNFLNAHDFSREEVRSGLDRLLAEYGVTGVVDAFL